MTLEDLYDLDRFVVAQNDVYASALAELRRGRKRGHWMWFVFPQVAGLGHSAMSQAYAIGSLAEARAYLSHDLLGDRYRECVSTLQDLPPVSAERVLGDIDAQKLRSSLTLFRHAEDNALFNAALARWFGGVEDEATVRLLSRR